ncbi:MAG: RNA polymerase sigma factor [Candidatus Marinimicrobia bacterium]|nr:RNA polymerase sigma factor [Candidatus Neomarinimicrobiota bacterium]
MENVIALNYQENRTGLLNYIKSKIDRLEEAEDILQDVYLQAMKSMNIAEPVENLLGWLFTVANHKIIDWYRKKSRHNIPLDEEHSIVEMLDIDDPQHLDSHSKKVISDSIMKAIDNLSTEQKNVFIMHHIENRSFREIAAIEDVSINTALARNRYAVQNLRRQIGDLKHYL